MNPAMLQGRVRIPLFLLTGALSGTLFGVILAGVLVQWRLYRNLSDLSLTRLLDLWPLLPQGDLRLAVLTVAGSAALVATLGLVFALRRPSTAYGDARFASRAELERTGYAARLDPKGHGDQEIIWAKLGAPNARRAPYVKTDAFPHGMVVAPSGAGKGVGFVIPNLLHFNGSCVVLDVKGENWDRTARYRQSIGDRVFRFSPLEPERSHRYNPLSLIPEIADLDRRYVEAQRIAEYLLDSKSAGMESFILTAKQLFCATVMLAAGQGKATLGQVTLGEVRSLLSRPLPEVFEAYAAEVGHQQSAETFTMVSTMTQKQIGIYVNVLNDAGLGLWANPLVAKSTASSDFRLEDLRRDPASIYLTIPPDDIRTVAPLARLFFQQLVATLQRREPGPDERFQVLIMLDEFDRLGHMEVIAEAFKTLRSYGGRLAVVTQSLSALEDTRLYGKTGTRSIVANAGMKLFMATDDDETARYVSDLIGDYTRTSTSRSHKPLTSHRIVSDSVSEREEGAKLLRPEQIARLPSHQALVLRTGAFPILAEKIRYFEDGFFAPRAEAHADPLPLPALSETDRLEAMIAPEVARQVAAEIVRLTQQAGPSAPPVPEDLQASLTALTTEIRTLKAEIEAERPESVAREDEPTERDDGETAVDAVEAQELASLEADVARIAEDCARFAAPPVQAPRGSRWRRSVVRTTDGQEA